MKLYEAKVTAASHEGQRARVSLSWGDHIRRTRH